MLLVLLVTGPVAAQEPAKHSLIPHTRAILLLGTVGGLMPFDARISRQFDQPWVQNSNALHSTASFFNDVGQPGAVVVALATLGTGLISGSHDITDAGLHASEAIAVSGTATYLIKIMAGRERPNHSPGDADEFTFAGGLKGQGGQSFPSGHTTAAFALAATFTDEVKRHDPAAAKWVGPVAYGTAGMVGLARMYSQKHWASDVMLGAIIGTVTAKELVKLHHKSR
ncbi:MAG TPA: phosphatase PAP2 family protein [Longimicrobiales bacterium]